jgi:acyl-CoA hydrolase
MKTPATPLTGKTPKDSVVIMTELVLPQHTNALGSIFGGVVMSWIDIAGAISSGKHSMSNVVTASIDALHFIAPIKLGHVVELKGCVNYTGKTSMEVGVRVDSTHPLTGERFHNVSAYMTFVAVDKDGKPHAVPPILPETEAERRRFSAAAKRRASRMQLANELKSEAANFSKAP